jgi:AcrR family transcriptional regulator
VLEAGVALLEERGYEAFTIAAVCERAQVVPRFLYARVDNKEALFLAVYEYGIARVHRAAAVFADDQQWRGLPPDQVVRKAVHEVVGLFQRHEAFMRSVVRISGVHEEVSRRGALYSRELGDAFTRRLLDVGDRIDDPDPESVIRVSYNTVFSAVIFRVAYGPAFATPPVDDQTFRETLTSMVQRYLFAPADLK